MSFAKNYMTQNDPCKRLIDFWRPAIGDYLHCVLNSQISINNDDKSSSVWIVSVIEDSISNYKEGDLLKLPSHANLKTQLSLNQCYSGSVVIIKRIDDAVSKSNQVLYQYEVWIINT